jgi:DNA polymerase-3 subunit epsilon
MSFREIVLDTETTGLSVASGHRIIEIGAVELIDKVPTGRKFRTYVNPRRNISEGAYRVHGISTDFLQGKPLFEDIAEELEKFIGDSHLVIHNAPFDMNFLNNEFFLVGRKQIPFERAIDTLVIAKKLYPGAKVSLDALCKRFKIDLSNRTFHGALKDAELLVLVYMEMVGREQTSLSIKENQFLSIERTGGPLSASNNFVVVHPSKEEMQSHEELLKHLANSLWKKFAT